jgi:hypothetical protein
LFKQNGVFTGWQYQLFANTSWGSHDWMWGEIRYTTPVSQLFDFVTALRYGNNIIDNSLLLITDTIFEEPYYADIIPILPSNLESTNDDKNNYYWVKSSNSISYSTVEKASQISLLSGYSGITANIGANSKIILNVADDIKNNSVINTPINSEFSISHLFAKDNGNVNNITIKGFSNENTEETGIVTIPGKMNGIQLRAIMTEVGVKFDWTPIDGNIWGYRIYRSKVQGIEGIDLF